MCWRSRVDPSTLTHLYQTLTRYKDDMQMSGTTCVTVVCQPHRIVCANVGDSRAVYGVRTHRTKKGYDVIPLSSDQTPMLASEKKRICSKYGPKAISAIFDEEGNAIGPERVWFKDCNFGLAMTRSLGDILGKNTGVIALPEYETVDIEAGESIIILASDGLWDMYSNEEALGVAMKHPSPMAAANALGKLAVQRWNKEEGAAVDDITITVVFLHCIEDEEHSAPPGLPKSVVSLDRRFSGSARGTPPSMPPPGP